ncbi:S-adenosyl-L-methionine-dependent methyltransferase [Jimgerdemannia flammicorona]|uniref:S-adenosyl-L-methionine-dependent methyltransferase n=1 Tax=Jimgerdemannia flammicorona TaxID=994334 RepID=A0A433QK89_9FUNG|nr:S-adenosyl-L-methionine-dependent methyltransferase [Jimgerdemannia flammicorona]
MGAAFSNPGTDMRRWKRQVECNGKFVKRPPEDHKAMLRSGTPDNSDPNFRWDEGRRFHATSSYSLPNDQEEIDRLFQQHFIFKNFHVPIENLLRKGCTVLDAGCGPGAWTLDMAIEYPDSHFYGIDICPVFDGSVHPPNVTFSLANLTDHLPFPDGHFDFVFMRCLVAGLQNEEWPRVICELMRVTKQGGWVELVEGSFRPHDAGPILEKIFRQGEKDILNLQFSLGLTSTRSPHSPAPSICRSQLRPESPSPKPVHRAQPRETPSRRWLPALAPLVRPLIVKLVRPARRDAGQRHPRAAHGVQALAEQVHRPVQHKVRRRGRCHVRRVQGEEELFECALRIWDEERAGGVC